MGDLLLTPGLYLTSDHAWCFSSNTKILWRFLVREAPEEEQDSKPFKATFLNQLWYEACDEKNNNKFDFSFNMSFLWLMVSFL